MSLFLIVYGRIISAIIFHFIWPALQIHYIKTLYVNIFEFIWMLNTVCCCIKFTINCLLYVEQSTWVMSFSYNIVIMRLCHNILFNRGRFQTPLNCNGLLNRLPKAVSHKLKRLFHLRSANHRCTCIIRVSTETISVP